MALALDGPFGLEGGIRDDDALLLAVMVERRGRMSSGELVEGGDLGNVRGSSELLPGWEERGRLQRGPGSDSDNDNDNEEDDEEGEDASS